MKSTTPKKSNFGNVPETIIRETELRFDSGITRAMLSGITRHTIRKGKRFFEKKITIHGYPAVVHWAAHTTLLHADIRMLYQEFGFKTIFSALFALQKFYPGLGLNDMITIVEYRLLV
jgi:hypothetical protein